MRSRRRRSGPQRDDHARPRQPRLARYQRANAEAMGFQPSNLIVSNVPGAPVPIYVAGAQVVAAHPVPPLVIGQGLNITLMSYQDSIDVGFIRDREKIDDPGGSSTECMPRSTSSWPRNPDPDQSSSTSRAAKVASSSSRSWARRAGRDVVPAGVEADVEPSPTPHGEVEAHAATSGLIQRSTVTG